VTLLDEPKGWRRLQKMALGERDPQKLIGIINQLNCLLDEHEERAKKRDAQGQSDTGGALSENPNL
jgi:hypothetical protein